MPGAVRPLMMMSADFWPLIAFGGAADVLLAAFTAVSSPVKPISSTVSSVLVTGPHGCGKTSLVQSAVKQTTLRTITCDSTWLCGPAAIDFVGSIDEIKRKAAQYDAVAVVFDNVDQMFPADDHTVDARALLSLCSFIEHCPRNCIVVGICASADALSAVREVWRNGGRDGGFETEFSPCCAPHYAAATVAMFSRAHTA
jgi:ethanolamine utilization protein EutP (predicted NTPase)